VTIENQEKTKNNFSLLNKKSPENPGFFDSSL